MTKRPLMIRFTRLEDALLSDRYRQIKCAVLWTLLWIQLVCFSVVFEVVQPPGMLEYLQSPHSLENRRIHQFFAPTMVESPAEQQWLRSWFGWIPIREPIPDSKPWDTHSVRGVLHEDGSISVQYSLHHSYRPWKTLSSGFSLLSLALALWFNYRHGFAPSRNRKDDFLDEIDYTQTPP